MNKQWSLFLDDLRKKDENTILAKNVNEAVSLIERNGFPNHISFDHDLGLDERTGKDFLNIIISKVLDKQWIIPHDFTFQVHSDNPVGSENIRILFNQFLEYKNINFKLERSEPYSMR